MQVQVKEPFLAFCRLDDYKHSFKKRAAGVLSEELRDTDVDKFDEEYGKRGRLLVKLRNELNDAIKEFGLEVLDVRMEEFVKGGKTIRLLGSPFVPGNYVNLNQVPA